VSHSFGFEHERAAALTIFIESQDGAVSVEEVIPQKQQWAALDHDERVSARATVEIEGEASRATCNESSTVRSF
jgi:hypothetical protein